MVKYNKTFELSIEDVDIIEDALNKKMTRLVEQKLTHIESTIIPPQDNERVKEIENEIKDIHNLLGRLHNQKNWYRPKGVYVSG